MIRSVSKFVGGDDGGGGGGGGGGGDGGDGGGCNVEASGRRSAAAS